MFETSDSQTKGKRATELVAEFGPFVNVPPSQVEKYINMQSADTLSELRDIVRNVKSSPMASSSHAAPALEESQSHTSRQKGPVSKKVPNIDQMLATHRKNKGLTWTSSYAQHFGEDDLDPDYSALCKAKKVTKDQGAFEKVWKPDQQDALNKWKQKASEQEVQLLANCCRGVFAVKEKEKDQKSSEYKARFNDSTGDCKVQRVERDRNRSEVPIGSIYTTDPWELVASAKRTVETRERMKEVLTKQDRMMKHSTLPKEPLDLCYIDRQKMKKYRGSSDVGACFSGISKVTGGSEYRTNFVAHC